MNRNGPADPVPRILLVEDSWENAAYVTELLDEVECVVDTARNGRQAIDLFEPGKYAVILMDCQMPVMDGFEATRLIRDNEANSASRRAHIVALTANATSGVMEKCLGCGMDQVIIKPFAPETLLDLLASRMPIADVIRSN
jgi:CheY-like chemotaxis protein